MKKKNLTIKEASIFLDIPVEYLRKIKRSGRLVPTEGILFKKYKFSEILRYKEETKMRGISQ